MIIKGAISFEIFLTPYCTPPAPLGGVYSAKAIAPKIRRPYCLPSTLHPTPTFIIQGGCTGAENNLDERAKTHRLPTQVCAPGPVTERNSLLVVPPYAKVTRPLLHRVRPPCHRLPRGYDTTRNSGMADIGEPLGIRIPPNRMRRRNLRIGKQTNRVHLKPRIDREHGNKQNPRRTGYGPSTSANNARPNGRTYPGTYPGTCIGADSGADAVAHAVAHDRTDA